MDHPLKGNKLLLIGSTHGIGVVTERATVTECGSAVVMGRH